jgi:hypothetical protein
LILKGGNNSNGGIVNELKDECLEVLFNNFVESWDLILKYRDDYPEVFDFRFLCHAN